MGRPIKRGLDYFPLDTNFFEDEKIADLVFEYGYLAEVVYLRVLCVVYKNGYYLEMSVNSLAKMIRRTFYGKNKPPAVDVFERVIIGLSKHELLDGKMMKEKIITSKGIQKQYLLSTQRRKNVTLDEYCLLDYSERLETKKYSELLSDTKDNKTKNKKVASNDNSVYGGCRLHFLTRCLINGNYIPEGSSDVIRFNELFNDYVDAYGFDLCLSVTNYMIKYSKKSTANINERFEYFKSGLYANCEFISKRNERSDYDYDDFLDILKGLDS